MSDPTYTAEQWGEWMRQLTLAIQNGHGLVVCDYQPPDVPYSIQIDGPPVWKASWTMPGWPRGVRIEMAPLQADISTLQPITVTAPIRLRRSPEIPYVDQ